MHRTSLAALALLLIPACPADPEPSDEGAGTGDSTTGATASDDTLGGSDVADTTAAESTGTGPVEVLAHGISIDLIEANQGVAVDLAHDGVWLGPEERQAPLIANRITLIRALWNVGGNWQPREIEGRLILQHDDGTEETLSQTKMVEGEAFIGDLSRAFFWGIMEEQMQPGLKFRIELYEVDDALADEPLGEKVPTFPESDGFEFVGVETSYQVMKVVVVPFNYDDGSGCATSPDTSEETMTLFSDLMYMQNPIDRLDYELHAPLDFPGEATNFGQLHQILVDLRFEENALPETYYYGLIDVCSGGLGDAGGQANGIPSDPVNPDNAYQRVSAGLSLDASWSAETIVHEVGHSQGRAHVACNGEGGPDPSYPWDGGVVNEWGFGVVDFQLRHPTVNKDYMTYCHPTWVGNWGWNKVYPVIRGLSMWDADFPGNGGVGPSDPYSGSLLFGLVLPDGTEYWKTIPGGVAPAELGKQTQIDMELADGSRLMLDARVQRLPDGNQDTLQIVAPLPDKHMDFAQVRKLARITDGQRHAISRPDVKVLHHNRLVVRD